MPHLDDETLALLALGEDVATADQQQHLATCLACAGALTGLRDTAELGRSALAIGELVTPDARVWAGIQRDLGLGAGDAVAASQVPAAVEIAPPESTPPERIPPALHAAVGRVRRPRRRVVVALLSAAVVVIVGVLGLRLLLPTAPRVVATATLAGLPAWPGASGEATVETGPNGRVLDLHLESRTTPSLFREVWLITSDQRTLVSLGVLHGDSGTFAVPRGLDLAHYDLVDVSAEPHDGNPHHSGDSIVRGALRAGA